MKNSIRKAVVYERPINLDGIMVLVVPETLPRPKNYLVDQWNEKDFGLLVRAIQNLDVEEFVRLKGKFFHTRGKGPVGWKRIMEQAKAAAAEL